MTKALQKSEHHEEKKRSPAFERGDPALSKRISQHEHEPPFLAELNREQREAVICEKGPLLIIAGAGTGKTKVITSRILHLIQQKNVFPGQILALTFTEKAQQEMETRIDLALPLSYEEMWIKTFHGFCDRVLRERGIEIGIDPSYKLLSRTQQWLFLKKHLYEFDLDYYRPLGNPSRFLHVLLQHFSRLKDEDISPEAYVNHAREAVIPAQTGIRHNEKFSETAQAYARYQELMLRENNLDFGDLVYYALRLFEKRPSVLQEYQEQFQHILVDEFQDTNFAQTKLTFLLAQKHKNLTVVADDDQSIYKWRGASLNNIFQFQKHFPETKKISLVKNYRSMQSILDASYALIQKNNPDRLEIKAEIDKKLISCHSEPLQDLRPVEPSKPEIWHFDHYLKEASAIADYIEKKEIRFADCCILLRANAHAKPFIEELQRRAIPYQIRSEGGLLSFPEIKDVVAVLKLLKNPYDDIAFYRYLHVPVFNIDEEEILACLREAGQTNISLFELLKQKFSEKTFAGMEGSLEKALQLLRQLFDSSKKHYVRQVIYNFLQKSGYLRYLMDNLSKEHEDALHRLNQFADVVTQFEEEYAEQSVRLFIEYLELLEESQIEISAEAPETDHDAVQILTVHSAKGLEFPAVFVVNLVQHRFPSLAKKEPIEIPEELLQETLPQGDHHLEEERRLMYVACTRAKSKLILTYSDRYEGKKLWKPSVFLSELSDFCIVEDSLQRVTWGVPAKADVIPAKADVIPAKAGIQHHPPVLPHHPLTPIISLHRLSYSQIDTFAACPLKYQFRYLLKLPTPQSHAANFGSSVHDTLNGFYQYLKRSEPVNLELMEQLYEKHWIPYGYESKAHENARKKQGLAVLRNFYEKNSRGENGCWKIPAYLERNFNLKIGNVIFTGRIDRIDRLDDGTYEVVDYKTGTSKRNANLEKDLQLSLYALACQEVFHLPVSKLSLYFLEDNEKVSTTRTNEQLELLKEELLGVIEEMRRSDFQPTPGFHCQFCDFRLLCPAV